MSRSSGSVIEDATVWSALQQFQTDKAELPALFAYNVVRQIVSRAVVSEGVIRNLAVELLRTLLSGEIRTPRSRNVVQARSFSGMRVLVKRILRKYGYPPDMQERATQTVLEQAEVLSHAWAAV